MKSRLSHAKLLLLATNQLDVDHVPPVDQALEIEYQLQNGSFRDLFQVIAKTDVAVSDIGSLLFKNKPRVLHFSGHGTRDFPIAFEKDKVFAPVEPAALAEIIAVFSKHIRLVFFSVCYTDYCADLVSKKIDYAIGMNGEILFPVAQIFSAAFYRALSLGTSVAAAFDYARKELESRKAPGCEVPVLFHRQGLNTTKPFIRPGSILSTLTETNPDSPLADQSAKLAKPLKMRPVVFWDRPRGDDDFKIRALINEDGMLVIRISSSCLDLVGREYNICVGPLKKQVVLQRHFESGVAAEVQIPWEYARELPNLTIKPI